MAEMIRRLHKYSHPIGLKIIVNISLILISIQITLNINKISDGLILTGFGLISACLYYFNIYHAD
jgi:hypothetical protein